MKTLLQPRRLAIVLAALALLPALAPAAHAGDRERPYRAACTTTVMPLTPPTTVPQELRIDADCVIAHLGRATGRTQQFVTPVGQSGFSVALKIDNTTTYRAANGDELNMTFLGTGVLDLGPARCVSSAWRRSTAARVASKAQGAVRRSTAAPRSSPTRAASCHAGRSATSAVATAQPDAAPPD